MATPQITHLSWIEISRSALLSNVNIIRRQIPRGAQIMAIVKANAYGHGLDVVAPVLAPKVDFFGVNTLSEALTLRHLKITNPILIAAPISPKSFAAARQNRLSLCVPSLEYLNQLKSFSLPIHLKINTGMNRLGLSLVELLSALSVIRKSSLKLEGVYTHFHSADSNPKATLAQLDQFLQAVYQTKYYFPKALAHCANSDTIFRYSQAHLDLVRPGLALYGLAPYPGLIPVLSWKCRAVQTRSVAPNSTVGYSAAYQFKKTSFMGVLPVGYSDGYDRKLSNLGQVWSANHYYPIVGRISMNFTTVAIGPQSHSEVELIGPHITATDIANQIGTINYEVVSRLHPATPRVIVK